MYYVQSPSRDSSHDGEKTTPVISPSRDSPPHWHSNSSSLGRGSRESSSTRFSRSTKPGGKVEGSGGVGGSRGRKEDRFGAIWELGDGELLLGEEEGKENRGGASKLCLYLVGFLVAFFILFAFFSLALWGASRHQKPVITMKSVRFAVFDVHSGMDHTGVATAMASTKATVRLVYQNRGTFFGVRVASTPLQLFYEQIVIAAGTTDKFYARRKARRSITVTLNGTNIPLYGADNNNNLNTKNGAPITAVPLTLTFTVGSRAYVLGRLVRPKFYKSITCSMLMDPKKMNKAVSLTNSSCTYQ